MRDDPTDLDQAWKLAESLSPPEDARRLGLLSRTADRLLALAPTELSARGFAPAVFARLALEHARVGDLTVGARVATAAAERLGGDLWFTAGRALARTGFFDKADAALHRYLHTRTGTGPNLVCGDPDASAGRALRVMGWIALHRGRADEALRILQQALDQTPAQGPTSDLHLTLVCDAMRARLRTGDLHGATAELARLRTAVRTLAPDACASREVTLAAAEYCERMDDLVATLPLVRAAMHPTAIAPAGDDRAPALCARVLLRLGAGHLHDALRLRGRVRGCTYDTLAVRLLLRERSGEPEAVPLDISEPTLRTLDALRARVQAG